MSINPVNHSRSEASEPAQDISKALSDLNQSTSLSGSIAALEQLQKLAPESPKLSPLSSSIGKILNTLNKLKSSNPKLGEAFAHAFASTIQNALVQKSSSAVDLTTSVSPIQQFSGMIGQIMQNSAFHYLAFGVPKINSSDLIKSLSTMLNEADTAMTFLMANYNKIAGYGPNSGKWEGIGYVMAAIQCNSDLISQELSHWSGDLSNMPEGIQILVNNMIGFNSTSGSIDEIMCFDLLPGLPMDPATYFQDRIAGAIQYAKQGLYQPEAIVYLFAAQSKTYAQSLLSNFPSAKNIITFFGQLECNTNSIPSDQMMNLITVLQYVSDYFIALAANPSSPNQPTDKNSLYQEASNMYNDMGDSNWQEEIFGSDPTQGPMVQLLAGYILNVGNYQDINEVMKDFAEMIPWNGSNQNENQVSNALNDLSDIFAGI